MRASLEGCRRRKKRKSKSIPEEVTEPRVAAGTREEGRMGGAQRESVSERESGAFATNKVGMGKFGEIRDDGGGGGGHGSGGGDSGAMRYDGDQEGGIKSDSAAPMSTLQESDPRYMVS